MDSDLQLAGIDLSPFDGQDRVLVGFSGGMDSTALLHLLAHSREILRPVRAIHVNHGLHADADRWTRHCQDVCAALGVELIVANVSVSRHGAFGLEAAAREARYAAFAEHLHPGETLALAHHRDDQAETVLLRLLRASGSDGLSAMQVTRPFAGGLLWRPLLAVPRADLLAYARTHGLAWIEDPSNDDHALDRNFLRQSVLPLIAQRWPQAAASLSRSAALLAEDAGLLRAEAEKYLAQAQGVDPATLSTGTLKGLSAPWRARVLRAWLDALGLPPLPGPAFAIIDTQLLGARPDAEPVYRWAGQVLRRWRGLLHVETARPVLPPDWQSEWDGREPLRLPTGDTVSLVGAGLVGAGLTAMRVAARQGGERITLPGRQHSHALKQAFQDFGIPPWERERLPLLFAADGELLAAGDGVISARLAASEVRLVWDRTH